MIKKYELRRDIKPSIVLKDDFKWENNYLGPEPWWLPPMQRKSETAEKVLKVYFPVINSICKAVIFSFIIINTIKCLKVHNIMMFFDKIKE